MKRGYVLVKRTLLVTAIALLAAIAIQMPVYSIMNERLALDRTEGEVLAQAELIAQAGNDPSQYLGAASMIGEMGGIVWLCDATGVRVITRQAATLPMQTVTAITVLGEGQRYTQRLHVGSATYVLAAVPAFVSDGVVTASFAVALPLDYASSAKCFRISLICAFLVALGAFAAGCYFLILPVEKQLSHLKETATAVADGGLSSRASEDGPGEIGELGTAINDISSQLAGSMYSMIIERNRLRGVLDGLSEGIVAVGADGEVTHTNPAMARLYPRARGSALYLPDARLQLIPDKAVWEDFDSVLKTGESITRTYEVRDMMIRMTISPIPDELDEIAGAVGLFRDVTQMERLERTRRDYVSNVSHELRTPLTAIRALVEPLKDGMVTGEEDRRRYYDIILREVLRLSRLINDQLELSRLQSGTVAITKARLRLEDLVMDVCERYDAVAREKGLELRIATDFSECPTVLANEDRVEQLLIILLDNAIKYTEKGSVSVSAAWDEEKVTITVADTGVGIAEKELPYVFDRFYKVDKAHSGKGSGLGLSIAHELLGRMGEEIWAESEQGKGTSFSFTLHCPEEEN